MKRRKRYPRRQYDRSGRAGWFCHACHGGQVCHTWLEARRRALLHNERQHHCVLVKLVPASEVLV